jgi:hypothetical protein
VQVALDIWPKIAIRRPHDQSWNILIHELRDLEEWVRKTAIPTLLTGTTDVHPLPPHLDITIGYRDFLTAVAAAGPTPAAKRAERALQAKVAREGLLKLLLSHRAAAGSTDAIARLVARLSDDEVINFFTEAPTIDPRQLNTAIQRMITDARSDAFNP